MEEKIENYELILDYYFSDRITKSQLKKAVALIRMNQFENIKFTHYGHRVIINGKEIK